MNKAEEPKAIVSWDFIQSFPHKIWISGWSSDESYPAGFRYKFFSTRKTEDDFIETVLVMEERGGIKTERKRFDVRADRFDGFVRGFLDGLEKKFGIDFELQDLSAVKASAELDQVIGKLGWHDWA